VQPASAESIQKSVHFLASPDLEGRGLGTAGLDLAAQYIVGYFQGLNLQPTPRSSSGYLQPFSRTSVIGIAPETSLKFADFTATEGINFTPLSISAEAAFDASVAFVGYGISAEPSSDSAFAAQHSALSTQHSYDDYAGVDLQGKIALAMRFEPHTVAGNSRLAQEGWSEHAAIMRKATLAAQHGAVALLLVHPPNHHGTESLPPFGRRMGSIAPIPVVQITQKLADDLLQRAGAPDLKTFQDQIDNTFSPRSFILRRVRVQGTVALQRETYNLKNVTAVLPGKGPHAKEYIVIGAHYDHLGRGGFGSLAPRSHEIHPGADDNASGTAAMLELARLFSQAKPGPRSILFCAFTGEEQGLYGSQYWVDHPPVPLKKIVAMINLDMVGRVKDDTIMVGGSGTSAAFPALIKTATETSPLHITPLWNSGVAPSDNTSFVLKRIPILLFFSGVHPDYHRPTDTPDKINYTGESQVVDLVANVVRELEAQKQIPFAEDLTAKPATQPAGTSSHSGGASLGVVPEYGDENIKGVKITGTIPNSAAARAGLQPGDILIQLGSKPINNIYDLTDALAAATPNQPIAIKIVRNNQPLTLQATLAERGQGE
jgi:hypothetical protein